MGSNKKMHREHRRHKFSEDFSGEKTPEWNAKG